MSTDLISAVDACNFVLIESASDAQIGLATAKFSHISIYCKTVSSPGRLLLAALKNILKLIPKSLKSSDGGVQELSSHSILNRKLSIWFANN